MERRPFGKTDMNVSVLGFGAAEVGFGRVPAERVGQILGVALDAGLNVIDTAECYLESETLIGQTVRHRRSEYYLFTKCGHPKIPGTADWRPKSLLDSIRRSLKRLKTDRLDLIQLHSCSEEELRRGAVIEALQTARKKGYARYIGYSGDSLAARYAIETGVFDALQTSVNILDQEAIEVVLPLARQAGIGVIAKRPIANAVWRHADRPGDSDHARYWDRMRTLAYDFIPTDESGAAATALRFTLMTPGVHTAIVGTTRPERWAENAASVEPGPLPISTYEAIRTRWAEVAPASWVGQT